MACRLRVDCVPRDSAEGGLRCCANLSAGESSSAVARGLVLCHSNAGEPLAVYLPRLSLGVSQRMDTPWLATTSAVHVKNK